MTLLFRTILLILFFFHRCSASATHTATGFYFQNKDWEIACDNTRTCRAAGYHVENHEMSISVLFTRNAGVNENVTAQLMLGNYRESSEALFAKLPQIFKLAMLIDGKKVDSLEISQSSLVANLSENQIVLLIRALRKDALIEWKFGKHVWTLSGAGASSILLKMDEFQGRVGTRTALYRVGSANIHKVLPPLPLPVVEQKPPLPFRATDKSLIEKYSDQIRQSLIGSLNKDDYCLEISDELENANEVREPIQLVHRLTENQVLVSTFCWRGSYNRGTGYWVIEDKAPFHAKLVTTNSSEIYNLNILAQQKGRGLGDCWSSDEWIWDGKNFVHSASSTSGMCRLMAPGGAWTLSTIVTH